MASRKHHPVLSVIHSLLLQHEDSRASTLISRVNSATAALPIVPTLHEIALGTITVGYQQLVSQYESPNTTLDSGLVSALSSACAVIDSLLVHCPAGWSVKILKWGIGVYGLLSSGSHPQYNPEKSMKIWLAHPMLLPVNGFICKSTEHLVRLGMQQECVECVVSSCSPHLTWLLAHIVSLHPCPLIPNLLSLMLTNPNMENDVPLVELLSHTHSDAVRTCAVNILEQMLSRWEGKGLLALLKLAANCPPFLEVFSSDCLKVLTLARVQSLVADILPSSESQADRAASEDKDDEGEIHSSDDEEEERPSEQNTTIRSATDINYLEAKAISLLHNYYAEEFTSPLSTVVCLLQGRDASTAINLVIKVYRYMKQCQKDEEESMEEGEIVHVSPVQGVVTGCEGVMAEVLAQLHTASQYHLSPSEGRGKGVEFAVGLQSGVEEWCKWMMEPDPDTVCSHWLWELVTSVSVCSSELQAASALTQLLSQCGNNDQLPTVLSMYWLIQSRHSNVALTTIKTALGLLGNNRMEMFARNVSLILSRLDSSHPRNKKIQSDFSRALSANLLAVTSSDPRLLEFLPPDHYNGLALSVQLKIVEHLLTHFFSLIRKNSTSLIQGGCVDTAVECTLSRYQRLLSQFITTSKGVQVFAYTTIMETVLSKEMSCYFALPRLANGTSKVPTNLLSSNQILGLSSSSRPKFNTRQVQHSGRLQPRQPRQETGKLEDFAHLSTVHSVDLVMQLLATVVLGSTDQLASVFLDHVAPHAMAGLQYWPEEDSLKYVLELDLSIARKFNDNQILWQILLLIAEGVSGLDVCASVVRSLLTVLSRFWQHCRARTTTSFPRELEGSIALIETMAKAKWLPPPLAYISELFDGLTPHELHLLLSIVYTFMKENFATLRSSDQSKLLQDPRYSQVLKGILIKNIHQFGHMYARYLHQHIE